MEPFISQISKVANQQLLNNLLPPEWRCDCGNTTQSIACIRHTSNYSLLTTPTWGIFPWIQHVPSHPACNSATRGDKLKAQAIRRVFHSALSKPLPQEKPCSMKPWNWGKCAAISCHKNPKYHKMSSTTLEQAFFFPSGLLPDSSKCIYFSQF